jgi:catechol 2,3-dioxygenase-like lactoylglutathione lyase family enzyme
MTNTEPHTRTAHPGTAITAVTVEVPDPAPAAAFYDGALGLGDVVRVRASDAPSAGFRGVTLSLVVAQPSAVDGIVGAALDAGAAVLKPVEKSFWGYGGVVRAPDGTIVTVASSSRKDTGPASMRVDDVVLLLGVGNVKVSRQFYVERGLRVARSFGSKYVEFDAQGSPVKLALHSRRAAAKNAGVDPAGSGSHRLAVHSPAGPFTDPDGLVWESTSDG